MLLVDAVILLLAIRFVGIHQAQLSWVEVVAAFLVAFPLTMFPIQGLGIFDATLVAALTSVGGAQLEAGLVAALVTYRVVTIGTAALLGALFIASWRHTRRQTDPILHSNEPLHRFRLASRGSIGDAGQAPQHVVQHVRSTGFVERAERHRGAVRIRGVHEKGSLVERHSLG